MVEERARVLIVDDQASARDMLKGFLWSEDYDLAFASNGLEALQCLPDLKPDTILLDVMMPDMNGFEVCYQLKADERWNHIPVILVTALDTNEDLVRGFEAGADDFLHKPVNSLELRLRVRSMLRIKRQFDQLQAALQLREDMAAMIVHDMRSPLTAILGLSELLLLNTDASPQSLKDMTTIRTQANRMNAFLNDMLMLTKIDQGKLNLNRSWVELERMVSAVVESYQLMAQSKEMSFVVDLPAQPLRLWLDANLFYRVLDNLVSNAFKFSPRGSVVTISATSLVQTDPASPQLRLEVRDEGPGIPEEHRESIFERFNIIELKKKNVPQVGLGLAFCKLVVEAHGGYIFTRPNQPRGSIFTIEI
jgi:signal transduction histidine kinase